MATIPVKGPRLVRKTITFTGGANAGQLDSPITVFAHTGLVRLLSLPQPYVSTALECANAAGVNLKFEAEGADTPFFSTSEMDFTGATGWFDGADGNIYSGRGADIVAKPASSTASPAMIDEDLILYPNDSASGANITAGVMVFFAIYEPLSDDGALAGDDIDETWEDHLWTRSERTLTAIDEDSTTLDIDATIRGAVGLASADLDTQLGALPTAAENADAVWDEAATGHTDAGKAGEQLWTDVDAILADTNELQTDDYPTSIADIEGKVDDLEGRLTATRAGYLDNLSAGAVALEATAQSILTDTGTTLDNLVDDLESRLGTPSDLGSGATVAANLADIKGETAAILDDTDDIGVAGAGLTEAGGTGDHLTALATAAQATAIETDTQDIQGRIPTALVGGRIDATVDATGMETGAIDAILTRAMTESYSTDGGTVTLAQGIYEILQRITEFEISGTTITVNKRDGSTTAFTLTLDDADAPTSTTRAS